MGGIPFPLIYHLLIYRNYGVYAMKKLIIVRFDGWVLHTVQMDKNDMPECVWSTDEAYSWDESEIAMVALISVGINTLNEDINYCEVMEGDYLDPNNN